MLEATAENTAEHTVAISTKVCNRYIFSIIKLVTGIPLICSLAYTDPAVRGGATFHMPSSILETFYHLTVISLFRGLNFTEFHFSV